MSLSALETFEQMSVQGKSSCMPAHALNPCKGWKVLDCCAAPGNKTTHLAALVGVEGSVIACEKDVRRFETLKHTLARSKASNVQPILAVCSSPAPFCSTTINLKHSPPENTLISQR